jgi:hypothetical protein
MSANGPYSENDLSEFAIRWLRDRLPAAWRVEDRSPPGQGTADREIDITGGSHVGTLMVEARRTLGPRDVARLFGPLGARVRARTPHLSLLVVAPWLSPRTRELLEAENVNYIDLTGNGSVRLDGPAVFMQTSGAERSPSPAKRAKARLRGPKAGRIARILLDVRPPYGVRELADAARVTPGYVSTLLEVLDDEAIIERSRRGQVESIDIPGLIRRWAQEYDVFTSNESRAFIAPAGVAEALIWLGHSPALGRAAITGSFAAVRHAPVAAPALLCVYTEQTEFLAEELGLLPADVGANVVLLSPYDPVVWDRTTVDADLRYSAVTQTAVDCLSGNGRMPAEGEALLDWLIVNEDRWRVPSLAALSEPQGER